jgi:hypothetical protein
MDSLKSLPLKWNPTTVVDGSPVFEKLLCVFSEKLRKIARRFTSTVCFQWKIKSVSRLWVTHCVNGVN